MVLLTDRHVEGRSRASYGWSAERGGPGLAVRRFRLKWTLPSAASNTNCVAKHRAL